MILQRSAMMLEAAANLTMMPQKSTPTPSI